MVSPDRKWWKEGIAYQIWPASYKDSNGDGVGDIRGIITTLDYLHHLGVDYVWLSPMYDSPQNDMGYDISDYETVYHKYGTLEDMETLIRKVHARGMKIILDLVVNHTSSEHAWFKESRKSRDNRCSDWYIWRDPQNLDGERKPPNNWRSQFAESAWTYVAERDQYYLHLFHSTMPDLNWQTPAARKAVYSSAIEFWLKRGIDGFRVDVVNFYDKDQTFPDAKVTDPDSETQIPEAVYYLNGPRVHEWLKEMRTEVMDRYDRDLVLVGELWGTAKEEVLRYVSAEGRELSMVFDFDILMIGADDSGGKEKTKKELHDFLGSYKLSELKGALMKVQEFLTDANVTDAWPTVFLENHDIPRSVSRYGSPNPAYAVQSAKVLALMICTLSGSLFMYQGQEFGMSNMPASWTREDLRDEASLAYLNKIDREHPGDLSWQERAMAAVRKMGRDNARTPVQWSSSGRYAGFTDDEAQKPWIRVNENFRRGVNMGDQLKDPKSILGYWKRTLKLRKLLVDHLVYGTTEMIDVHNENVMTFLKRSASEDDQIIMVSLNFSEHEQSVVGPAGWDTPEVNATLLTSTYTDPSDESFTAITELQPWEGRAYSLVDRTIRDAQL